MQSILSLVADTRLKDTIKNMVKRPWPARIHSANELLPLPPGRVQPYETNKSTSCHPAALLQPPS